MRTRRATLLFFVFIMIGFLYAEPTPPTGETLLQWRFGVTPKIDVDGYDSEAGYSPDGNTYNGGYPYNLDSLIPTKHTDTVDYAWP